MYYELQPKSHQAFELPLRLFKSTQTQKYIENYQIAIRVSIVSPDPESVTTLKQSVKILLGMDTDLRYELPNPSNYQYKDELYSLDTVFSLGVDEVKKFPDAQKCFLSKFDSVFECLGGLETDFASYLQQQCA